MSEDLEREAANAFRISNVTMGVASDPEIHRDGFMMGVAWAESRRTPGPATAEGQLQRVREILATLCRGYRAGGFGLWDTVALAEAFLAEHGAARPAQSTQE